MTLVVFYIGLEFGVWNLRSRPLTAYNFLVLARHLDDHHTVYSAIYISENVAYNRNIYDMESFNPGSFLGITLPEGPSLHVGFVICNLGILSGLLVIPFYIALLRVQFCNL